MCRASKGEKNQDKTLEKQQFTFANSYTLIFKHINRHPPPPAKSSGIVCTTYYEQDTLQRRWYFQKNIYGILPENCWLYANFLITLSHLPDTVKINNFFFGEKLVKNTAINTCFKQICRWHYAIQCFVSMFK